MGLSGVAVFIWDILRSGGWMRLSRAVSSLSGRQLDFINTTVYVF
jgi:hypothetical protein